MVIKQNKELLEQVLKGQKTIIQVTKVNNILRNDILTQIKKSNKIENVTKVYLSNKTIQQALKNIYEDILDETNKRQSFGPGTFKGEQGKLNCIILTKYVLEEKLQWSLAQTVRKINYKVLYEYKLRCAKTCFKHIYDLIIACYPEANLKPYYFKKASNVWFNKNGEKNEELIKEAIREFIEVLTNSKGKYKYKIKSLPTWINYKMFRKEILPYETNLSYLLNSCFGNSHIKAVMFAYPELNLKPYYFSNVPNKYWSGDEGKTHAKEVMKELVVILTNPNGDYKLSMEEVKEIFKFKTYAKPILPYRKNLRGMLQTIFKNSPSAPFKLLQEQE